MTNNIDMDIYNRYNSQLSHNLQQYFYPEVKTLLSKVGYNKDDGINLNKERMLVLKDFYKDKLKQLGVDRDVIIKAHNFSTGLNFLFWSLEFKFRSNISYNRLNTIIGLLKIYGIWKNV